ncbi:hypothetical protein [Rufibacter roseolus]|uniref:hypothetical protein n=1 Tax=Rufibacter roseolus TaxID=2817375 RepID=UPI001B302DE8|nr:hypothetical protein [Rufibacter roseolus]
METLTNHNRYAPAPGGQGRHSFFGVVFAGFLVLFLAGVLYFTRLTDFSSPEVTSTQPVEDLPAAQEIKIDAAVTGSSVGTTANLAGHAMFAPLLGQPTNAAPLIFR